MRTNARVVATALYLTLSCMSSQAGRAVFTGANDAEPINAGFRRDSLVLYDTGFQIVNGDNPYRDFADHSIGPTGYSDTWPDFFPELDGDIHPELVEAIGANDFTLALTLDPESTRLRSHTNRSGQRFGVYLQFDRGQVHGGAYLIMGFDGMIGAPEPSAGEREGLAPRKKGPGNRPFALVGQGYWSYYVDLRDVTGTAETITLVRRGDVFQLYTASGGSSFIAAAGQRADATVHPDVNGTLAVKPNVIKDIGPNRTLTAMALWTESADGTPFDAGAGRLRSLVIESEALPRDINPESHVAPVAAINTGSTDDPIRRLSGTVLDADTREPVDYAHVALQRDGVTYVVITGADGSYEADLRPGGYRVDVTAKGYEPQAAEVAVDEDVVQDFAIADLGSAHRVGPGRPHKTIQAALTAANDGDTIHLDPGVYTDPLTLISNIGIRGAGRDRTQVAGEAYRDLAITPFLAEYYPPYGADGVALKAALANVVLAEFTLDGGEEHETFAADTISERLALLMAIDRVDLATVKTMLKDNPELAKVRYYTEDSPSTGATFLTRNMDPWVRWTPELRADNVAIARLLVENGADIEGFGGYAWSSGGRPLHIAANHDNVGVARLLLEAGADPNALARDRTPLEWSTGQGVRVAATATVLMDRGAKYNPLHLAHFKLLDRLEEELGDRIDALYPWRDAEPTSLLHMAVRNDFPDVVAWLLERGANPDLIDANGVTPKEVAITAERSDAVRELLGLEPGQRPL
ncbi:MAG: carboxypeptidase regulatory-like domain-containing protein [Gammaproteobacteria bacterium]|nr:carboxypeptidase regulatory-like domain-containing protein [Gammaproteobacteria bacterium]MDE0442025.1 carboxypeptidase regulatory-like domain-containing protein [Gammaproteobacteria bacterium]